MLRQLRPALFLDRDGVINEDIGYLHRAADLRLITGAATLIREANALQLPVVVITNQAGIGRGLYSEEDFHTLMGAMQRTLAAQGAHLDGIYFSPFHPEHGIGKYRRDSNCRKPKPGMLLRAASEHHLDLHASALVGDRCTDMQAAEAASVPHRFLLAGTEPSPCSYASCQTVRHLDEVTQWLQQHFSHDRDNADAVAS